MTGNVRVGDMVLIARKIAKLPISVATADVIGEARTPACHPWTDEHSRSQAYRKIRDGMAFEEVFLRLDAYQTKACGRLSGRQVPTTTVIVS